MVWRDIFVDNADELRAGVAKVRKQLDHLESLLRPEAHAELKQWLEEMARIRQAMG